MKKLFISLAIAATLTACGETTTKEPQTITPESTAAQVETAVNANARAITELQEISDERADTFNEFVGNDPIEDFVYSYEKLQKMAYYNLYLEIGQDFLADGYLVCETTSGGIQFCYLPENWQVDANLFQVWLDEFAIQSQAEFTEFLESVTLY